MDDWSDDDVHAWADGQLADRRRRAFEQAMANDPALAERATAIRRQNEWLTNALDPLLHEPIPRELRDVAERLNAHIARRRTSGDESADERANARVLAFDPSAHRRADRLLPWFVNGTLEGDDLDLVARHLAQCTRCEHEVEWLREVSAACTKARTRGEPLVAAPASSHAGVKPRAWRARSSVQSAWRNTSSWTRFAMAAQLGAIVVLGAVVAAQFFAPPAEYRTLGSPAAQSADASIVVVFDPNTTQAEMLRLLRMAGARIVGGPTQANGYLLAVPPDRVGASLATLQAQPSVVLAAPLAPTETHR